MKKPANARQRRERRKLVRFARRLAEWDKLYDFSEPVRMGKKKGNNVSVTVRMDADKAARLEQICESAGITTGKWIEARVDSLSR